MPGKQHLMPVQFVAIVTLTLWATFAWAGENWPQFRGPGGDGHSDAVGIPRRWSEAENVTWKTAIHDRGWSSPVIWGSQIWMTTAAEDGKRLYGIALDRDSGEVLHDIRLFHVEEPQRTEPLNSFASPTPVIEAGRVYLHFGAYGTACVDTTSGNVVWSRRNLPCNHFCGPASSPVLFEDLLIMHYDGFDFQYVVALDRKTGKTVWKTDRSNDYGTDNGDFKKAFSTPLVIETGGRRQLISVGSKAAMSYEPRTGEELWQVRFKSFSSIARPFSGHGLVFINTGLMKADLLAVEPNGRGDVTDTHVVWTASKSVPTKTSQLLVDDLIYMIHDGGVASCLEAKTGTNVWSARLAGEYSASPVMADGAIYFCSHDGKTTVVEPGRNYRQIAVNQLDDGMMASPAIAGNAIFLRTKTHVYRIEKPR